MKLPCGCCEGVSVLTPLPVANRPGRKRLHYRAGTHAVFLASMIARLSGSSHPELAGLTTRDPSDPSLAMLDAWATVADVLTFYQERIAHEGYLRTATERRSVLELSRLVGYNLRPGVASSVYLAYTLEKGYATEITAGQRAQSLPAPGELPQSFETSELLRARSEWNAIKPRMTRPQDVKLSDALTQNCIYLKGISPNLKPNDRILLVFGDETDKRVLRLVREVILQPTENRTKIVFQNIPTNAVILNIALLYEEIKSISTTDTEIEKNKTSDMELLSTFKETFLLSERYDRLFESFLEQLERFRNNYSSDTNVSLRIQWLKDEIKIILGQPTYQSPLSDSIDNIREVISPLLKTPSIQPFGSLFLNRNMGQLFQKDVDTLSQVLINLKPELVSTLYPAWTKAKLKTPDPELHGVYVLRLTTHLFGYNAPQEDVGDGIKRELQVEEDEKPNTLFLDNAYEKIFPDSYCVIDTFDGIRLASKINSVIMQKRIGYGFDLKTTKIILSREWWEKFEGDKSIWKMSTIRNSLVFIQSEPLELAEEPVLNSQGTLEDISENSIELDSLYDGIRSGRWIIVSGERTDIPGTSGVTASELAMVANAEQTFDPTLPGDTVHTILHLFESLAYTYKRDTVTIYANVVRATHGETRTEILGSGDGSKALQQFTLSQSPLTHISAPTVTGTQSTLQVRVNDILWHEAYCIEGLAPTDRKFITKTDDAGKTSVISGNGVQGARLPSGVENVKAVYRTGIGSTGNVKAGQISLLATKPLGVKGVINPIRASGGADRETRDQARRNAPLATMALDRIVSVQDYAGYARTFAGIGKADARMITDGIRRVVHLTIAGADDIPIDETSDLFRNLKLALQRHGDPYQPVVVAVRELQAMVISASVRLLPDFAWETTEPRIRAALLDAFSFDRRELGQSVFLSEVISVIQNVEGVDYVDIKDFTAITQADLLEMMNNSSQGQPTGSPAEAETQPGQCSMIKVKLARPDENDKAPVKKILPAQLAYLLPEVPDTLILNEVTV